MDRALPEFNRILHKKWLDKNKKLHREKVKGMAPRIDMSMPKSYNFPISTGKKDYLIEGK